MIWNEKLTLFGELIGKEQNFLNVTNINAQFIVDMVEKKRHDDYDVKQRDELKQLTDIYLDIFINTL